MLLTWLIAGLSALAGLWLGYRPLFRIEQLNRRILLNSLLTALILFTLLMIAWASGYLPHLGITLFMAALYGLFFGFFSGYALRLFRLRERAGNILYTRRSFWVDMAPAMAAILLILFGIYRTSILLDSPVTALRLISGLSLVAFGVFALTLKMIPELRSGGILFLDKMIPWKQVIGWKWESEEVIGIEYVFRAGRADEQLRELFVSVPPDEKREIQSVLESEMEKHNEQREELLKIGARDIGTKKK